MDCRSSSLTLGEDHIEMLMGQNYSSVREVMVGTIDIRASEDIEIPGRAKLNIYGEVKEDLAICSEGIVEVGHTKLPRYLYVGRTLNHVSPEKQVILQVMNTSPTAVTIYKGMKLGELTPIQSVDQENTVRKPVEHSTILESEIELTSSDLTMAEKTCSASRIYRYICNQWGQDLCR